MTNLIGVIIAIYFGLAALGTSGNYFYGLAVGSICFGIISFWR